MVAATADGLKSEPEAELAHVSLGDILNITTRLEVSRVGEYKDKIQGEAKDVAGKVTGDKKMEWEGKAQKVKGKVEEAGRKLNEEPASEPVEPTGP